MKTHLDKKGQLNGPIFGIVAFSVAIVIISIVFGIGAKVTDDLYVSYLNNASGLAAANTTLIFTNATAFSTFTAPTGTLLDYSSVVVYNTTGLEVVQSANYSLRRDTPAIRWVNASTICAGGCFNGTNVTISFQVTNTSTPTSAAALHNGTVGIANISQYTPTLALVIVAGLVVTLLVGAFAIGRIV